MFRNEEIPKREICRTVHHSSSAIYHEDPENNLHIEATKEGGFNPLNDKRVSGSDYLIHLLLARAS